MYEWWVKSRKQWLRESAFDALLSPNQMNHAWLPICNNTKNQIYLKLIYNLQI